MKQYKGFHLERIFPSGMWATFSPETGYLRADTLQGLKQLINDTLKTK